MNKIIKFLLFLLFSMSPVWAGLSVDVSQLGAGARSLGMGKASLISAVDPTALSINPANLGYLKVPSLTSMQSRFINEIDYLYFSGAMPMGNGVAGVSITRMAVEGIGLTTRDSNNRVALSGDTTYTDTMIHLGYGFAFNEKINFGAALKINFKGSPAAPETQGFGNNIDLGLAYEVNEKLKTGLVAHNAFWGIGPLGTVQNATGSSDVYKTYFSAGLGYQWWDEVYLESNIDFAFADYRYWLLHVGAEYKLSSFLYLRCGIDQQNNQIKQNVTTSITFGVGVNYDSFKFDYAYHPYNEIESQTTHFFSLSYFFNLPVPTSPKIEPTPLREVPKIQPAPEPQIQGPVERIPHEVSPDVVVPVSPEIVPAEKLTPEKDNTLDTVIQQDQNQ